MHIDNYAKLKAEGKITIKKDRMTKGMMIIEVTRPPVVHRVSLRDFRVVDADSTALLRDLEAVAK